MMVGWRRAVRRDFGSVVVVLAVIALTGSDVQALSEERIRPLLGEGYVAIGWVEGKGLYVLNDVGFDSTYAYLYRLYLLPVEGGPERVVGDLRSVPPLEGWKGDVFQRDSVLYLITQSNSKFGCAYVKVGQTGFAGPYFYSDPDRGFWTVNRQNNPVHIQCSRKSWQLVELRPDGFAASQVIPIKPCSGFEGVVPLTVEFLPGGRILCLELNSAASARGEALQGLGPSRSEWIGHWIIDSSTGQMVSYGRDSLSAVDFGSVPGWLNYGARPIERLGGSTGEIGFLIEGGRQQGVPGLLDWDFSGRRLHLLRFSDQGELLSPAKAAGLARLVIAESIETPQTMILCYNPRGGYRVILLDRDTHLASKDL